MLHTVDLVSLPDRQRKTTNTSTMAAAGNGPLAPQSKIPLRWVGLIGDDDPSKRIWFLLAMNRSKAHKMLRWCSNDDMNLTSPLECFGDLYWLVASKSHIRLIGPSYPIHPTRRIGIYNNIYWSKTHPKSRIQLILIILLFLWKHAQYNILLYQRNKHKKSFRMVYRFPM